MLLAQARQGRHIGGVNGHDEVPAGEQVDLLRSGARRPQTTVSMVKCT